MSNPDLDLKTAEFRSRIENNWIWILILGIVLVIAGIVLIAAPLASSIAVTYLIAACLIIGGAVQIYHATKSQGWRGFIWSLITGIIALVGGVAIIVFPLAGVFAATLVVAVSFIAQGVSQLVLGFKLKPANEWKWVALAGLISLVAGLLIWFDLPGSATWVLGLIAGISVMFNGWSYIAIALAARAAKKRFGTH